MSVLRRLFGAPRATHANNTQPSPTVADARKHMEIELEKAQHRMRLLDSAIKIELKNGGRQSTKLKQLIQQHKFLRTRVGNLQQNLSTLDAQDVMRTQLADTVVFVGALKQQKTLMQEMIKQVGPIDELGTLEDDWMDLGVEVDDIQQAVATMNEGIQRSMMGQFQDLDDDDYLAQFERDSQLEPAPRPVAVSRHPQQALLIDQDPIPISPTQELDMLLPRVPSRVPTRGAAKDANDPFRL